MTGSEQSLPLPVVAALGGRPTLDRRAVADYAGRDQPTMCISLVVIDGAMLLVGGPSLDRGRGTRFQPTVIGVTFPPVPPPVPPPFSPFALAHAPPHETRRDWRALA